MDQAPLRIECTDISHIQGTDVVARAVPVPQELLDAAEAEYARICAEAKEAGARRKPPRPAAPTAAVFYAPEGGDVDTNVADVEVSNKVRP